MTTPDNKPTSLQAILNRFYLNRIKLADDDIKGWDMVTNQALADIAAYYEGLLPTEEQLTDLYIYAYLNGVDHEKDLEKWSARVIDTIQRNFTGQTDNEREDSRI